jgi:hypothetical protein
MMVSVDSNVVVDSKEKEDEAEQDHKTTIQRVSKSLKKLFELITVSRETNKVQCVGQVQIKIAFNEKLLAGFEETRKQASMVRSDSKTSSYLILCSTFCYGVPEFR